MAARPSKPQNDSRLTAIDFLRTWSILPVLAVHLNGSGLGRYPDSPFWLSAWSAFERNGSYGVTLFFVISGFLISRMIQRSFGDLHRVRLGEFYQRRAARILPLLVAMLALGAVLVQTMSAHPGYGFTVRGPQAAMDSGFMASVGLFFFNLLRVAREANFGLHWDVLWSLSIEEQFYLVYPALLLLVRRRAVLVPALLGAVILGPVYRNWAFGHAPGNWLLGYTHSFACFEQLALGCLAFLVSEKWDPKLAESKALATTLTLGGTALVLYTYLNFQVSSGQDRIFGPSLLALGGVFFILGARHLVIFDSRVFRAFAWPGKLTYGIYLGHGVVFLLLWNFLAPYSKFTALAIVMAVTTAFAWLSFRFFEEPVARALTRLGRRRETASVLEFPVSEAARSLDRSRKPKVRSS